jgi:hypothetical protein
MDGSKCQGLHAVIEDGLVLGVIRGEACTPTTGDVPWEDEHPKARNVATAMPKKQPFFIRSIKNLSYFFGKSDVGISRTTSPAQILARNYTLKPGSVGGDGQ